jgi:hypothetical protein
MGSALARATDTHRVRHDRCGSRTCSCVGRVRLRLRCPNARPDRSSRPRPPSRDALRPTLGTTACPTPRRVHRAPTRSTSACADPHQRCWSPGGVFVSIVSPSLVPLDVDRGEDRSTHPRSGTTLLSSQTGPRRPGRGRHFCARTPAYRVGLALSQPPARLRPYEANTPQRRTITTRGLVRCAKGNELREFAARSGAASTRSTIPADRHGRNTTAVGLSLRSSLVVTGAHCSDQRIPLTDRCASVTRTSDRETCPGRRSAPVSIGAVRGSPGFARRRKVSRHLHGRSAR